MMTIITIIIIQCAHYYRMNCPVSACNVESQRHAASLSHTDFSLDVSLEGDSNHWAKFKSSIKIVTANTGTIHAELTSSHPDFRSISIDLDTKTTFPEGQGKPLVIKSVTMESFKWNDWFLDQTRTILMDTSKGRVKIDGTIETSSNIPFMSGDQEQKIHFDLEKGTFKFAHKQTVSDGFEIETSLGIVST
jgi:hypothetical protein